MLLGREAETQRIAALLGGAGQGRSGVLVVEGEPGIGKSALVSHACGLAADGIVLRTIGVPGESELPYVNLGDLLRPVAHAIDAIPPRQRAALAAVLALGPADAGDRLAVAAATLSLLGAVAGEQAVLIAVDDVQWVDPFTAEVLLFVANRLGADGIAMLLAVRAGEPLPAGFGRFETLTLGGIDGRSARQLVHEAGGARLDTAAVSRLVTEANGNPLALRELPKLLTPAQLALWSRGADPLPIDSVMAQAYLGTVRQLPAGTQDALLVLAVLGSLPIALVEQTLTASGLSPSDLDPAERAGLVVVRGNRWEFGHPLVRAAVHENAPPSQRRRAHLCAAQVLTDSDLPTAVERRAWHLVAAGSEGDEWTAAVIEQAAGQEAARSNLAVAGKLFERSAQLTPAGGAVAARLLRAADCTRMAGAVEQARELLRRALPLAGEPRVQQRIRYFLCRIDLWRGSVVGGRDELLRLADTIDDDPGLEALVLSVAALASMEAGELSAARRASDRAMLGFRHSPAPLPAVVVRALVLGVCGDTGGADVLLAERARELDASDPLEADLAEQMLMIAGMAHLQLEQTDRAETLLERAVAGAREGSALGVLPFRLGRLSLPQYWRGRLSAALASAHEALQLADDTGWVNESANSHASLARIEAVLDRADDCREHARRACDEAESSGAMSYALHARAALGLLALSRGEDESAADHLLAVADFAEQSGARDSPLLWWSADLVEALVRLGELGAAAQALQRLDDTARVLGQPTTAAVAARCRSLLEPDEFARHLTDALHWHAQAAMPFEQARTELQLGAQLRRRRLRGDARPHLESALARFDRLGAQAWAARTRIELEAAGVHLSAPRAGLSQLTPQELQVVLKVASGMANREVATHLFLSVKTVEFHLRNAFHKLGVKRRTQLVAVVAAQDPQVATTRP